MIKKRAKSKRNPASSTQLSTRGRAQANDLIINFPLGNRILAKPYCQERVCILGPFR